MNDLEKALIQYGIKLIARGLRIRSPLDSWPDRIVARDGKDIDISDDEIQARLNRICTIIGDEENEQVTGKKLCSIFCIVKDRNEKNLEPYAMSQKKLDMNLNLYINEEPEQLWKSFCKEVALLPTGAGAFETFFALMCKYGWYLRGTTMEDDISIFEQFKAVVSLSHCISSKCDDVLLIAGDIPGIQSMVYTITSKGALKTLKGRSLYLQLLNDAIVRAILRELKLPWACVIYNAGGNFKVMARVSDEQVIESLAEELNRRLLLLHGGSLSLVMARTKILVEDITDSKSCRDALDRLNKRAHYLKRTPWATLAGKEYKNIFGLQGEGREESESGRKGICSICHDEIQDIKITSEDVICKQCRGYEKLADQVAQTQELPYQVIKENLLPLKDIEINKKPDWEGCLLALGSRYIFGDNLPPNVDQKNEQITIYKLNSTIDFIPVQANPDISYSFRFLPNLTPRIENDDLQLFDKLDERLKEEFVDFKPGNIRDITTISILDATGISWYGLLRMDIDDLGTVFAKRLNNYSLLHISALSANLELFFQGWLNVLCQNAARKWKECLSNSFGKNVETKKTPYIIYSGGDDIFIIGPWDVLPNLALDVKKGFSSYVCQGYVQDNNNDQSIIISAPLTISAGLVNHSHKFPLYQAAELAKIALNEKAKERKICEKIKGEKEYVKVKDAINWLDVTLSWSDFQHAKDLALKLVHLIEGSDKEGISRSLMWILYDVAKCYKKDEQKSYSTDKDLDIKDVVYGRWMWLLAYSLKRLSQRLNQSNEKLAQEVMHILNDTLDLTRPQDAIQLKTIRFLELPVKWAELLLRKGE